MRKNLYCLSVFIAVTLLFSACSKEVNEYNKPAVYWYGKIIKSIGNGDIDQADDCYSSLQGEHIASPLLPEATMILAMAHMHFEEYLLAKHFLNEYAKRYADENEIEYIEFLKIKAKYMALPNPRRDQALIAEAIEDAKAFKENYPHSIYYSLVDNILTNLYLADGVLNETIALLYERVDKPKAAAYYRAVMLEKWIKWDEIERANTPWYKTVFEGDGTSSWYKIIIPDTKSVVSRNSVNEDINSTK